MLVFETSICLLLLGVIQATAQLFACDGGQVGLGGLAIHIQPGTREGTIFNSTCGILDGKPDITDSSICGEYEDGSRVICDESGFPQSGVLSDGSAFGDCFENAHDCDNLKEIQFCCPLL